MGAPAGGGGGGWTIAASAAVAAVAVAAAAAATVAAAAVTGAPSLCPTVSVVLLRLGRVDASPVMRRYLRGGAGGGDHFRAVDAATLRGGGVCGLGVTSLVSCRRPTTMRRVAGGVHRWTRLTSVLMAVVAAITLEVRARFG